MEAQAAAAVQDLVQIIIDSSRSEIHLIGGLQSEAAKLTEDLDIIQKYLDGLQIHSISDDAVRTWLMRLENAAFDADNVLDELSYHHLSRSIKPIKPLKEKVLSCFSPSNSTARKRGMAVKIKETNEKLESIYKMARDLGLVQRLPDVPTLPNAAFETDSFTIAPIFIGRDDVVSEIVEILTTRIISTDERVFPILAIVGMGGLGKTTLTKKVFNHQKVKSRFGSFIWVHVSQIFDQLILFKKILNELTPAQVESNIKQDILKKLQEALKDKTCLLVLDDVWNQDPLKWEDFINSLLGVTSSKGNAIVVTTRNTEVASIVNPQHTHELQGLSEEDCWSIIKEKTFGKGDVAAEFETIGMNIAKRCQGLPLAANVVGGLLRNKSKEEWLSIEEKWLSHDEADNITRILRLSFDNLSPSSLKKCFAYCSVFSKGEKIEKQALIEDWMAEGFVKADGSYDMESIGDKFINVLLHNSLLQISERDYYGCVKSCVMHDLVHNLTCSVSGSYNNADGTSRVRYRTIEDKSSPIPKEVAKYLRTLFMEGEISATMFSDFESLHVLTLGGSEVKKLPNSIGNLIHLRKLDISSTRVTELPQWIGELHHLQTLRALRSKLLPSTLKYLINLRHLYINYAAEVPVGIGKLTSLQTLEHFRVGEKNGCKVEELGSLNNLKGTLNIYNLERVHNKEEAEKASLFKKSQIFELSLRWEENRGDERNTDENVLDGLQPHSGLKKLEIFGFKGKRFPLWSRKMTVRDGPQSSSWLGLDKLMYLSLLKCSECEEIPMLGQLPNLKSLVLKGWSNLKSINSSFYGSVNEETLVFPALKRLELDDMPKLAEAEFVGASEVIVFPRLQHLEIRNCQQLASVPMLGQLPNLKSLVLKGWSNLKCINSSFYGSVKEETRVVFPALERLELVEMPKLAEWAEAEFVGASEVKVFHQLKELHLGAIGELECLPGWLFYNSPNLSKLQIRECPKLRELPDGLCNLNCLEVLIIEDCPNLERIADSGVEQSQGSSSLRDLVIRDCPKLRELPDGLCNLNCLEVLYIKRCPNLERIADSGVEQSQGSSLRELEIVECDALVYLPCEMVGSSLQRMWLEELRSLKNLPSIIDCLSKTSRLTELVIEGVPNFMATRCVENWAFGSLHGLSIDVSIGGSASMETVDGMLQGCSCHSLRRLTLKGKESWECVPESIQHLTSLRQLELMNFGMEELPEWLGNLSSLECLFIDDCKKLRRLPSMDAMRSLTRLEYLEIKGCPELQIQKSDVDSEWPKISHIPNIYIDCPPLPKQEKKELRLGCL